MKTFRYFLLAVTLAAVTLLSGCKSDDPTPQQANMKKLTSGAWTVSQVTVDGVDQSSLFTGMTLQFTKTTYTATNGVPVWPTSGSWTFVDKTGKLIRRDNELDITIVAISTSELKLSLDWDQDTYSGGRRRSVAGEHLFTFRK